MFLYLHNIGAREARELIFNESEGVDKEGRSKAFLGACMDWADTLSMQMYAELANATAVLLKDAFGNAVEASTDKTEGNRKKGGVGSPPDNMLFNVLCNFTISRRSRADLVGYATLQGLGLCFIVICILKELRLFFPKTKEKMINNLRKQYDKSKSQQPAYEQNLEPIEYIRKRGTR